MFAHFFLSTTPHSKKIVFFARRKSNIALRGAKTSSLFLGTESKGSVPIYMIETITNYQYSSESCSEVEALGLTMKERRRAYKCRRWIRQLIIFQALNAVHGRNIVAEEMEKLTEFLILMY